MTIYYYEARKRKTHAGLGGNAISKFSSGKLGPHIAGSSGQEVHRMSELMLAEFRRFRAGEKSDCEVTPAMLATMA